MVPEYIAYKQAQQNEFLSAAGIRDPELKRVYRFLCTYVLQRDTPEVDVEEFITVVRLRLREKDQPDLKVETVRKALRELVDRLEKAQLAAVDRDEGRPTAFRLVQSRDTGGPDNRIAERLKKRYALLEYDLREAFPSAETMDASGCDMKTIGSEEFGVEAIDRLGAWSEVVGITFTDFEDILCMSEDLEKLLVLAHKKIHFFLLNNKELFDFVFGEARKVVPSKAAQSPKGFFDLLERTSEASPSFWVYLTLVIYRSREKASQVRRMEAGDRSFYQSAYLVHGYWQSKLESEKREKLLEADARRLLASLRETPDFFKAEQLLDTKDAAGVPVKSKYDDPQKFFGSFLDLFSRSPESAGGLPSVVTVDDLFIHRMSIVPFAERRLGAASIHLRRRFLDRFSRLLRKRDLKVESLSDDTAFRRELEKVLEAEFPRLALLLGRPEVLWRALREQSDSKAVVQRLSAFLFESVDPPRLRPPERLLSLQREELLEGALSGLPLIPRFLLRYRLRLRRDRRRSSRPSPAAVSSEPGSDDEASGSSAKVLSSTAGGRAGGKLRGRGRGAGKRSRGKATTRDGAEERRSGSDRAPPSVDDAVEEFRKAIHKARKT